MFPAWAIRSTSQYRRQSGLVAQADLNDAELRQLMDDVLTDVGGWTE
ncbi:antitoxin MazE-like protein [Brenneria tiliae]|nr:antitoxin MazE-like protein [Brenneria tiliae]MCL2898720.1 hypothetical protein [Brenneria tiliae]MCL2903343.1 hypothetical protein [Brenneria tiliae]